MLDDGLPPLAALRAFEAAVRLGGIRKAGFTLGVHHSVISRHISNLEARLGVQLLVRSERGFLLAAGAERYYERISAALADIAFATGEIGGPAAKKLVRAWCSPGLTVKWLLSELRELERSNPGITIELRPSELPANLLIHEADVNLYFRMDGSAELAHAASLKSVELVRPTGVVVASPALVREIPPITSVRDLLALPLLHASHKDDWRSWFKINGIEAPQDLPGELCWDPNLAVEAARLGRGILLALRYFVAQDLRRGELVEIDVPEASTRAFGSYMFVAREDRWSDHGVAIFRKFLSSRMKTLK